MSDTEGGEGGTKIQRRPRSPPPQQQMEQPPPQVNPMEQQMYEQQMHSNHFQQHRNHQMQPPPPQQAPQFIPKPAIKKSKSPFGIDTSNKTFRYSLLVVFIFIILNSKIVWKQITRIPMMGTIDPSIIALIVNSVLAGIIFYVITNSLLE